MKRFWDALIDINLSMVSWSIFSQTKHVQNFVCLKDSRNPNTWIKMCVAKNLKHTWSDHRETNWPFTYPLLAASYPPISKLHQIELSTPLVNWPTKIKIIPVFKLVLKSNQCFLILTRGVLALSKFDAVVEYLKKKLINWR